MRFKDRIAIVTGAGSRRSIGRTTALTLARDGADIVVADLDLQGAKAVADEIKALGRRSFAVKVDITKQEDCHDSFKGLSINSGGLISWSTTPGLPNHQGIGHDRSRLGPGGDYTNLKGTFLCSKAVLPTMIKQGYGRIVNLSSVSGKRGGGVFGGAHYSAAKAGILDLQRRWQGKWRPMGSPSIQLPRDCCHGYPGRPRIPGASKGAGCRHPC